MRFKAEFLAAALSLAALSTTFGQGTFRNLDFESVSLVPPGDPLVQFGPAFPGWTGYIGGVQQTAALYNSAFLDSSGISIIDSGVSIFFLDAAQHIKGNFTALLQAGFAAGTFQPADTTLAQTGLIPASTQSLLFTAYAPGYAPGSQPFSVTLGGQLLSLLPIQSDANSTLYGADIHGWAGQSTELAFTAFAQRPHQSNFYLYLDSIQFSNQPIPEPSVFGLFGLGALLFGWRCLHGKN